MKRSIINIVTKFSKRQYIFLVLILIILLFVINITTFIDENTKHILTLYLISIEDKWIRLYYYVYDRSYLYQSHTFRIPKVCYQTWITKDKRKLSSQTLLLMSINQILNPDITFELWDDNDIDIFIQSEFPPLIYQAYKTIHPTIGAAKADFFRYCIIYKRGGIYLDLKSSIKIPYIFGNMILPQDRAILDIKRLDKMAYRNIWNYGAYEQWFLIYEPFHPYLEKMIIKMTMDILNHITFYQYKDRKEEILRLTGPDAYSVAIHDAIVQYGILHKEINYFIYLRYRSISDSKVDYKLMNKTKYSFSMTSLYRDDTTSTSTITATTSSTTTTLTNNDKIMDNIHSTQPSSSSSRSSNSDNSNNGNSGKEASSSSNDMKKGELPSVFKDNLLPSSTLLNHITSSLSSSSSSSLDTVTASSSDNIHIGASNSESKIS